MFKRDALLDLLELGADKRIIFVAARMESREGLEAFFGAVMINQPSRGFRE